MIKYLEDRLSKRQILGNFRCLKSQRGLIDFSSNDYLGLARSSILSTATMQEWGKYQEVNQLGSTGSRLMTGNSDYVGELESQIAAFHGYETALLFNCGYMANLGLLSAIGDHKSVIFYDNGVHVSTLEGIRLSRSQAFPFRHNHLDHLETRLKNWNGKEEKFICIESLYSTDGSLAPLSEIFQLAHEYNAHMIVDEAHAVGVNGPEGRGLLAKSKLTSQTFAQMHTFGKALGVHGAVVMGSRFLKDVLINFARSFIYTTALPVYSLAAIACSYRQFPHLSFQRRNLHELTKQFKSHLQTDSSTHIQSILVPGVEKIKKTATKMMDRGFQIKPLMSPTVQRGKEVLRICLHAFNTENEIMQFTKALREVLDE